MSTRISRLAARVSPLVRLGYELDANGFGGCEADVRRLIRTARAQGIDGPAVGVLADITAPDVARLRAFAVVSAALVSPTTPRDLASAS